MLFCLPGIIKRNFKKEKNFLSMANGLHMSNYKKILFTGGNGRFGKVFEKLTHQKNIFILLKRI